MIDGLGLQFFVQLGGLLAIVGIFWKNSIHLAAIRASISCVESDLKRINGYVKANSAQIDILRVKFSDVKSRVSALEERTKGL